MPRVRIFPMDIDVIAQQINRVNECRVQSIHQNVFMGHVKTIDVCVFPVGLVKHVQKILMNVKVNPVQIKDDVITHQVRLFVSVQQV